MPRVRYLQDDADQGHVLALARPAARIRRAFELTDDRPIEDREVRERPVPPRPARYLLIQEYADEGRGVGQAIVYGQDPVQLLADAQDEISDGWVPVEVHDLDTGRSWGVDLVPTFCGPTQPWAAVEAATAEIATLATACQYDPEREGSVDALIAYKDALEARLHRALATGASA